MRRGIGGAALAIQLLIGSAAVSAPPVGRRLDLLPLTIAQVTAAGAAGTGCSWSAARDRRMRFAAADDRAVVRLATGIVELRPADSARDLFPFTFDRWIGTGIRVTVLPHGRAARKGTEASERPAVLSVTSGGVTVEHLGRIDCGS